MNSAIKLDFYNKEQNYKSELNYLNELLKITKQKECNLKNDLGFIKNQKTEVENHYLRKIQNIESKISR